MKDDRMSDPTKRRQIRKWMSQPWGPFEEVDLKGMRAVGDYVPPWATRAFKNNRFTILVSDDAKLRYDDLDLPAIRALFQKLDDSRATWPELQRAKNEVFGAETWAVQYFPAVSKVIDDHNIYWLWISDHIPIPI